MAECAYCKADTSLYEGGVPICVKCTETRGGASLQRAQRIVISARFWWSTSLRRRNERMQPPGYSTQW